MSIYAIGDIQGCFQELQNLIQKISFDPVTDQLWFTGDLVNRGPDSLKTLRFIKSLGHSAITVLGNHDLHLLAVAEGISNTKSQDTFNDVLKAPDRDELLHWLRHQPLLYKQDSYALLHAGLAPQWHIHQALELAGEVEARLRGDDYVELLSHMYGDYPDYWDETLTGWDRYRFILNCLTRLRYCHTDGRIDLKQKTPPGTQPLHLVPWYSHPLRKSSSEQPVILFGHWSSLGYLKENGVRALDTGCLWGGKLTALKLGQEEIRYQVNSTRAPAKFKF